MHTDEYEISLSREIAVCLARIRKLRKALLRIEKAAEMSSAAMISTSQGGGIDAHLREWQEHREALLAWEQRLAEFEEIRRRMRE
ncbi:MAG: hypothetical protein ACM3ON_05900 [Chloroflexota bacterium]